jgi:hypothetical protein
MYLESLIRLAEILETYNQNGEKLISKEFHADTEELIKSQTKFLVSELEFVQNNPGPYDFGFGDLVVSLFSPEQTGEQEWAGIARKGTWQKNYRFNSTMGLVKTLTMMIQDSSEV